MSHVTTIQLHITDLDALALAAEKCGCELVRGQETFKWYGQFMGDSAIPKGFKASDYGKCLHAIRVKNGTGAEYEIGVVERKDGQAGYALLWDAWQGGYGLEKLVGKDASRLSQHYTAQKSALMMMRQGFSVQIQQDGNKMRVLCRK